MAVAFASTADLRDQPLHFDQLAPSVYAATADGDPNVLVVTGDDGILVVDTTATPAMAQPVIEKIRAVSSAPLRFVVLSHYHAVRTLGASAYDQATVVASRGTYDLIAERGEADYQSEFGRFPRLFRGADSIPGLTWPHLVFEHRLTLRLGRTEVEVLHFGRGHTRGDTVVWLPRERVLFGGDSIDYRSTPYCGDAYLKDWRVTLQRIRALQPQVLVPGRGKALQGSAACDAAFDEMDAYLKDVYEITAAGAQGGSLKAAFDHAYPRLKERYGHWFIFEHCIPFSIARAYDEACGIAEPRIWTAERDRELWAQVHG
ncbi:MAG: MBL fold metallo-hydrolase [Burkholderiales bacterium]|nr:MBL fold metallo-hydrolase [Burkholderiales bacterium]